MPIFEFKCLKCDEYFELLVMKEDDEFTMTCPECKSEDFERVLSTTTYVMNGSPGEKQNSSSTSRTCSGGSCTTYEIPGPP